MKKNFKVQDVYKLIYQGVFGVAHILDNPDLAYQYLKTEFALVKPAADEPIMENISVSGEIVRINLRPYKKAGGKISELFQIMVLSAEEINGSQKQFIWYWEDFKTAVFDGRLKFDKSELNLFDNKIKQENYPAIHHSEAYRQANKPAYRVVKKSLVESILR